MAKGHQTVIGRSWTLMGISLLQKFMWLDRKNDEFLVRHWKKERPKVKDLKNLDMKNKSAPGPSLRQVLIMASNLKFLLTLQIGRHGYINPFLPIISKNPEVFLPQTKREFLGRQAKSGESSWLRSQPDKGYMVEILWHRRETRRQTEKTNLNLCIWRNRSTRLNRGYCL
jgi:hypothetical protein